MVKDGWNLELECKPDFEKAMDRIYAWYEGEIIDRAPVRFSSHNVEYDEVDSNSGFRWKSLKEKWFDEEYQVEKFIRGIKNKTFVGETFPIFWPNLGPNVYAAFYGCPVKFRDVTSWAEPCIDNYRGIDKLELDMNNEYFKKIESMTKYALERCSGKFMVGYTDLHPGLDCVAAWRGTENLCFDIYDSPEEAKGLINISIKDFCRIFDYFDSILKGENQLSVTWMGIPSFGKMHIPSCDFSSIISSSQFEEFCLPILQKEVALMTHNIFHLDGKEITRHLDIILKVPEIQAIQWVQGVGDERPIMQWIPLIKKIQAAGKSVVVDLYKDELEGLISEMRPEGLLLCLTVEDEEEQKAILKRVTKW